MAEWIDLPAMRVLRVPAGDLVHDFERIEGGGDTLYRRLKDNRVFKIARVQPLEALKCAVTYFEPVGG